MPRILGLFDFSVAPALLFYAYIPILVVSIFFGVFFFRKNDFGRAGRAFIPVITFFVLWIANIIVQWTAAPHGAILLGWKLTAPIEVGLFLSTIRFVYIFLHPEKDKKIDRLGWLSMAALSSVVILTPSALNIVSYDYMNCEGEIGLLWYVIYALEVFCVGLIGYWTIRAMHAKSDWSKEKQEALTVGFGTFLFAGLFSLSNIIGEITQSYEINLIGPLGMVILLVSLVIVAVRYRTPRATLASMHSLVFSLWALVFSLLFISDVSVIHLVVLITFILMIYLGVKVLYSAKKEIVQKERFGELNKRLTALDATKNEFLSFATHQLRSPLTSIKWGLASLKEGYSDETADKLLATTDDLIGTVNDLLDISKIEQGGLVMKMEEFDLHDFVGRVVEEFRRTAENKGLRLAFTGDIVPCFVVADENKLRQVFVNLIDNAIKYTVKGDIKVVFRRVGKTAEVSVWDTGPGIAAEELKDLFDKFLRGAAGKASQGGSGLGLYLAKKIVEAHHGQMRAASPGVGRGSIFTVALPLKS